MSLVSTLLPLSNHKAYSISPKQSRVLSESLEFINTTTFTNSYLQPIQTVAPIITHPPSPLCSSLTNLEIPRNVQQSSLLCNSITNMILPTMTIKDKKYNIAKTQLDLSLKKTYTTLENDLNTGIIISTQGNLISQNDFCNTISHFISSETNSYLIYFTAKLNANTRNHKYCHFEFIHALNTKDEQRFVIYVAPLKKKEFKKLICDVHSLYNNTVELIFGSLPTSLFIYKMG